MPFHTKAVSAALSIVAVATLTMIVSGRAQQDPPPAGQEAVPDAKPQGDPAPAAQEPSAQAPIAQAPAAPLSNPPSRVAPLRHGPARSASVTATVNLRSGPGTDSEVITTIPAGSTVGITSCSGEWCAVTWNGRSGYAIARNLGDGAPRQARPYGVQPGYAGSYELEPPPVVYGAPGYYAPPAVVYGPAYYGPRVYYGPGWRRRWW